MKYEILTKYKNGDWEHCDFANDYRELQYMLDEYHMAYGCDFTFKFKKVTVN